eukprot:g29387.t1
MKELCIPTVVAITGNAIGGGACPIMMLSKHLPQHVGLTAAIDIYLTDSTFSANAVQKAGMVSRIASDIRQGSWQASQETKQDLNMLNRTTKATALAMARKLASFPGARLAVMVQPPLSAERYEDEAYGIYTCSRLGQMHFPGQAKA